MYPAASPDGKSPISNAPQPYSAAAGTLFQPQLNPRPGMGLFCIFFSSVPHNCHLFTGAAHPQGRPPPDPRPNLLLTYTKLYIKSQDAVAIFRNSLPEPKLEEQAGSQTKKTRGTAGMSAVSAPPPLSSILSANRLTPAGSAAPVEFLRPPRRWPVPPRARTI